MRGAITSRGSELWAQVSCDNVTACCSRAIYCNRALKRGYLLQRVCQSHNTGYRSISQIIENNTYIFQAAVNSTSDAVLEYLSRQAVQWSWWWREVTGGDKRCHVTEPSRKHLFSQFGSYSFLDISHCWVFDCKREQFYGSFISPQQDRQCTVWNISFGISRLWCHA